MKKNIFKKLGGAFLGLALGLGVVAGISSAPKASEVKADSADITVNSLSVSSSGFTVTSAKAGGSNDPITGSYGVRLYANNTFTVETTSTMTNISIAWTKNPNKAFASVSASTGSYSHPSQAGTGTWTGSASKVVFTVGGSGQIQVGSMSITYSGGTPTTNYTVTFDVQGHGTAPQAATVASGGTVTKPADPSESGYTFGGWYKETGCTNAWVFETDTVSKDTTIYAKWTKNGGGDTPSGNYTLVTSVSDLKDSDKVIIAIAGESGPVTGVTGMNTNNKDVTVSGKSSDWIEYTVTLSGNGFTLKYDTSSINFADKAIKYGSASVLNVTAQGYICLDSTPTMILFNQQTFYRPYTNKLGTDGYTPFSVYKVSSTPAASLVSISTLSGTVSAKTGDTSWKIENVSVTGVLSDSASVVDVSKYVDVSVTQEVPTITADGTMSVTLKATGKTETTVTKSVSVTATLKFVNPYDLSQIYGAADNTEVTIDGIYMGDVRDAMIIMDGEYGANIYYGTGKVPAHSYVPGETKLTVTGTTTLYKGLEEVKPTSVSVLTDADRIAKLSTPEVYICTGNETSANPELASRKTNATGYVTAISDASGNKNVTLSVGGKSVAIFVGSVYATEDVMNKLNASKDNTTDIVVEGFTSFYNGNFQIQFTGLVEQKADYTADDFAAELLELTDAICEGYDGVTNNKDALGSVWLVLQDADHYLGLVTSEQEKVEQATADASGSDLEKAVARYDYLVAKYKLTQFIEGRHVSPVRNIGYVNHDNNSSTTIIIVVSVVSLTTLAALLVIKRRKAIEK